MYESFFGFREKPFTMTPDPRFLYLSSTHREALAQLIYGVKERKGFVVLSGEVGTGKTTIVRALLERLDQNCQVAYVFNPKLSVVEFLKYVCHDFGFEANGETKIDYLIKLHDFLIESHNEGKTTILIVDEAQNSDAAMFEEIRMLTNLETSSQKLLQIFLVGQPELNELLEKTESWQLKQRISARYHLIPLDQSETKEYIITRMRIAGARRLNCFTEGAINRIYEYSQGIPRLINNLCDNSLLIGYATDVPIINEKIVRESAADLRLGRTSKGYNVQWRAKEANRTRFSYVYISLILITLIAAALALFLFGKSSVSQNGSRPSNNLPVFSQGDKEFEAEETGVTQEEKIKDRNENLDPQLGSKATMPVGASLSEPELVEDFQRELVGESSGTEAIRAASDSENLKTRIAVAREGESISEIILREFGQFDIRILPIVQELNPQIKDLDQIKVGQEVRLPIDFEEAVESRKSYNLSALPVSEGTERSEGPSEGGHVNEEASLKTGELESKSNPDIGAPALYDELFRVVIFQEGDTMTRILIREFGRVDEHLLRAVKILNPEIEDFGRIGVGQKIRLPGNPKEAYENPGHSSYFSVHVASFRRFDKAVQQFNSLNQTGDKPTIIPAYVKGKTWYRLTVGEYEDFAEAYRDARSLIRKGQFVYAKAVRLPDLKRTGTERVIINWTAMVKPF